MTNLFVTKDSQLVDVAEAVKSYVEKIQIASDIRFKNELPHCWANGQAPIFKILEGKKYFKIIDCMPGSEVGSVFCFVDQEGNIYKPASYATPAKGARGSVFDSNPPVTRGSLYRYR